MEDEIAARKTLESRLTLGIDFAAIELLALVLVADDGETALVPREAGHLHAKRHLEHFRLGQPIGDGLCHRAAAAFHRGDAG